MQKEIQWLRQEKYFGKPSKKFDDDVERLEAGEPLDYVIGFREFLGCKIDLSKKPLIPRTETEFWVEESLKEISKGKILDIFSGSGCIGVALLKRNKKVTCDFSDITTDQIKVNVRLNKIPTGRYRVIKSNLFENIKGKYDYIVANPPYIPTAKRKKVGKSVLKYEPKEALFGGKDGLFFIKKFLKEAKSHVNSGGKIFMEFDPPQRGEIQKMLKKEGYASWEFNKDQFGKWRWIVILR